MTKAPLLEQRSPKARVVLILIVPAAFGALTGYLLGVSEGAYLALSLLAVLGGIAAGFEHLGARAGATRGLIGGVIFGAFVLIAHEIHGAAAEAHLPEPAIVLVVLTGVIGALLGALGGYLRARSHP